MSRFKSLHRLTFTLLMLALVAVPDARSQSCKSAQDRTNAQAYSRSAGGNSPFKQSFMPAMGGGGGGGAFGGGMGQNLQTMTEKSMHPKASQRKSDPKDKTATLNNRPAPDVSKLENTDQQQMVDAPHDLTAGLTGAGSQYMGPSMASTMPRMEQYYSGGFFDGLKDIDGATGWMVKNENAGRGSGGGGGPLGDGPGAKMYYENHMPGSTPRRPTNPLAMPGVYNFSGPTAPQIPKNPSPNFSSSIPGMKSFMPFCCQKNLPCCSMGMRCCTDPKKEEQKKNQNQNGGGGGGGGGGSLGGNTGGNVATGATSSMAGSFAAQFGLEMAMDAAGTMHQAKSNGSQKQGSGGGSKGEGALEEMNDSFSMMLDHLINVANESAGSPTGARSVSKTYQNAVWMVQQMYKNVYLQIALLLILPGALLTNIKSIVGFSFLNLKDEDTLSPFTGIQRAIIAIFLIPATQLFVSYVIDTANALSGAVAQEVNLSTISTWAKEQVQTFEANQQGEMIKNLPIVPRAPWRGKAASMPKMLGLLEQMSYCDIALTEAINQCVMALSIAALVFNVFQITFMCYLYLMGPICAAFFAWPGVGRELFRKAFSSWMDGVVILALWKFWWDIVLLCWGVWIENGHGNPYELVNGYYCIGWMCLLMFVPFNPFDFKVGEIVSTVLAKAESAAAAGAKKGAQGAKKGGGGPGPGPGPGGGPG